MKKFLFIILAFSLTGCTVLYPIARRGNCLDWVLANMKEEYIMVFGWHRQYPEANHAWIKAKGNLCKDVMNKGGFKCDSPFYKEIPEIDLNDPETLKRILKTRI